MFTRGTVIAQLEVMSRATKLGAAVLSRVAPSMDSKGRSIFSAHNNVTMVNIHRITSLCHVFDCLRNSCGLFSSEDVWLSVDTYRLTIRPAINF